LGRRGRHSNTLTPAAEAEVVMADKVVGRVRLRRVAAAPITRAAPPADPLLSADATDGEVPERSIGAVSKTVVPLWGTEGSNPSLSARPHVFNDFNDLLFLPDSILTNDLTNV
jgi:hypothetical protein